MVQPAQNDETKLQHNINFWGTFKTEKALPVESQYQWINVVH